MWLTRQFHYACHVCPHLGISRKYEPSLTPALCVERKDKISKLTFNRMDCVFDFNIENDI